MVEVLKEYKIKNFSTKINSQNKLQGILQLEDLTTGISENCNLWQDIIEKNPKKYFKTGNLIKITDGYQKGEFPFNISTFELLIEAKAGLDQKEREVLFNKIIEIVDSLKNDDLKSKILNLINENKNLFIIAPAAKSMHHNYVAGLMQHIFECIELVETTLPKFKIKIDRDLMISACITHDIGKIFEYKIDVETGIVEINEEFRKDWISHTQFGFNWAMNNNLKNLAKIIAAHHGRNDWGAIIDLENNNLEPEVYLMHNIDNLSAKFGSISIEYLGLN